MRSLSAHSSLPAQHPDSASDPTWAWPAKDGPWAPAGRGPVRWSPPWAEPVSRGPSSSETILLGNKLSVLQSPSRPGDFIPHLCSTYVFAKGFIERLRKKSRRLCLMKAFMTCTAEPSNPLVCCGFERWSASWLGSTQVWVGTWSGECTVTAGAGLLRVPGAPRHAHPWGHPT